MEINKYSFKPEEFVLPTDFLGDLLTELAELITKGEVMPELLLLCLKATSGSLGITENDIFL